MRRQHVTIQHVAEFRLKGSTAKKQADALRKAVRRIKRIVTKRKAQLRREIR